MQLRPNNMAAPSRASNPSIDTGYSSGLGHFELDPYLDFVPRDINIHAERIYVFNAPGNYDITLRVEHPNSALNLARHAAPQRNAFGMGMAMAQQAGQRGAGLNSGHGTQQPVMNGYGHGRGDPGTRMTSAAPAAGSGYETDLDSPRSGRNGFVPATPFCQHQPQRMPLAQVRTSSPIFGHGHDSSNPFDHGASRNSSALSGSVSTRSVYRDGNGAGGSSTSSP